MTTSTGAMAAGAPHVLVFPLPLQGHVYPTLKLAEALTVNGVLVTFLTTDHVHHRLRMSGGVDALLDLRPSLRLRSIPDGLPADHPRSPSQLLEANLSLATKGGRETLRHLLVSLRSEHDGGRPPLTCAIVDGLMPFAAEVAEEVGIPVIACRTSGPCSYWAYFCIPKLIEEGEVPFPEGCDMDELVRGVPGMESFLRRRDLPSPCRAKDVNDPALAAMASATQWTPTARGLIFNSMEPLDAAVLTHIRSRCPVTYTVGPLHNLVQMLDSANATDKGAAASIPQPPSASPGLWPEDRTCMPWLDAQPAESVVYVSFGSLTVLTKSQLLEFWHGLVKSNHRFLWVIRPDLLGDMDGAAEVPAEVTEGTKEKGCIVGWAPQQEVLGHPAVGSFLTHSGWNSTLESISAGVPMICWPFFFDQLVNSRFVTVVWRVGVDMKDTCDSATVEKMVREVMEGERAEELRRNAAGLAKMVQDCTGEGGSSRVSLGKLVQDLRSMSPERFPV